MTLGICSILGLGFQNYLLNIFFEKGNEYLVFFPDFLFLFFYKI